MKKNSTIQKSDRKFQVWEYQVSHGQLLIRSPKAPPTGTAPEFLTNLDIVCLGVDYMALPRTLHGIELMSPISDEIQYLENLLGKIIVPATITILASEKNRFPIVSSSLSVSENDWDIFESPFQFRSQFRSRL